MKAGKTGLLEGGLRFGMGKMRAQSVRASAGAQRPK